MQTTVIVCLFALLFCHCTSTLINRPVIGILTQPYKQDPSKQYIVASYVKFVEAAGAIAVPIFYNDTREALQNLFFSLNGLLFTGGGLVLSETTEYFRTAQFLWNLTLQAYAQGNYFPLWGTCQGMELFHILAAQQSNDSRILQSFDAWDMSIPVQFTGQENRMFGTQQQQIVQDLQNLPITMHYHHLGTNPATYTEFPALQKFFTIIATDLDRQGKPFVSIMEAKTLPIYATQFHPEWPIFEWDPESAVSHTAQAIRANSYFASFFINEARKNTQSMDQTQTLSLCMDNYQATFSLQMNGDTQTYFF